MAHFIGMSPIHVIVWYKEGQFYEINFDVEVEANSHDNKWNEGSNIVRGTHYTIRKLKYAGFDCHIACESSSLKLQEIAAV